MTHAAAHPWPGGHKMMLMARRGRRGGGHRGRYMGGYPMGKGEFFRGRPRVSRGDVRIAILRLLDEEPMHGYQIIQELTDRTDGVWMPSPGSIYPTLQQLEDEGLVRSDQREGKNVFTLTEAGRTTVSEDESPPPWERLGGGVEDDVLTLREAGFGVGAAVMQIAREGSEPQIERAIAILNDARKKLYRILAEDEPTGV